MEVNEKKFVFFNFNFRKKNQNEKRMKLMNDYMHAKEAKDQVKALSINPCMVFISR